MPTQNTQNHSDAPTRHPHQRWYKVFFKTLLVSTAGIAMFVLGVMTYGIKEPVHIIGYGHVQETVENPQQEVTTKNNTISFSLPEIPSDKKIDDILNRALPDVCDSCKKKPLTCLHRTIIDKRVIRGPNYEHLALDVKTGHVDRLETYTVVLDLRNNLTLVRQGGTIKESACREVVNEVDTETSLMIPGQDTEESIHINMPQT